MTIPMVKSCFWSAVLVSACVVTASVAQTPAKQAPGKTSNEAKLVEPAAVQPPPVEGATKPHDDTFVIGNDDVLSINVWKEPDVSRATIPVRSDGRISLPLAGEIQAAGKTPLALEQDIASKLQSYISEPEVTVMVTQINSRKFNILGQVNKAGFFPAYELPHRARRDRAVRRFSGFCQEEVHLCFAAERRRNAVPHSL